MPEPSPRTQSETEKGERTKDREFQVDDLTPEDAEDVAGGNCGGACRQCAPCTESA